MNNVVPRRITNTVIVKYEWKLEKSPFANVKLNVLFGLYYPKARIYSKMSNKI